MKNFRSNGRSWLPAEDPERSLASEFNKSTQDNSSDSNEDFRAWQMQSEDQYESRETAKGDHYRHLRFHRGENSVSCKLASASGGKNTELYDTGRKGSSRTTGSGSNRKKNTLVIKVKHCLQAPSRGHRLQLAQILAGDVYTAQRLGECMTVAISDCKN